MPDAEFEAIAVTIHARLDDWKLRLAVLAITTSLLSAYAVTREQARLCPRP